MARLNEPTTAPSPSNIPPFAKPLAPYIKSRQETLRIRQALTNYLRSQITFVDNDLESPECHAQSHLSLNVSENAVSEVKRIPAEFTGLRREYLQALQANIAARKQQQLITEKLSSEEPKSRTVESPDSSLELHVYLRLIRDRRRHAKLQVFEHYLHELQTRWTARPEVFESHGGQANIVMGEELGDETQTSGGGGDIEELVHKLERAVIRAKSQLDQEKRLYQELKVRNEPKEPTPAVKAAALQRTRDELVQWVEEKLVGSGNGEEAPVEELPTEEIEESARILEEQRVRILEQYAAYTETRKQLLEAAARACQPVSTTSTKSPPQPPDLLISAEETLSIEPLEVLTYASDVLLPLSKIQRSLALQKFHLSGMLAKEKSTAMRLLNRLGDESHLLPEYPIPARQPRFKHAAAALNPRLAANQSDPAQQDEIIRMAEDWAFASAAAGSSEKEYVEHKVIDGGEHAHKAEDELQRVYNLLNQNLEEALRDEQGEGDNSGDIWAHEARSTRSRTRLTRSDKRSKGPWTRLDGTIGIAE
ncbi:hypothetical protein BJY04DRAFT_190834 [Aspergillus karnatakaensis]|uniref:uncharacterized protein n=1 Tax=Aspergillus karnatakaensis TaxID=1810916 RepID=UPI003CCDA962